MRAHGSNTTSDVLWRIGVAVAVLAAARTSLAADLALQPAAREQLARALARPLPVRQVDTDETTRRLNAADAILGAHLDPRKGTALGKPKRGAREVIRFPAGDASPIGLEPRALAPGPGGAGYVWYAKGPAERSYRREVEASSAVGLPVGEARQLAKAFAVRVGLAVPGAGEEIGAGSVTARKRRPLDPAGRSPSTPELLSQRVEFTRTLDGLPVLNSRLWVEFHPASREVLAFHASGWVALRAGVAEQSGNRSMEELEAEIGRRVAVSTPSIRVTDARIGYLWTGDLVVPVAVLKAQRPETNRRLTEWFVVSLVRGIEAPAPPARTRAPSRVAAP